MNKLTNTLIGASLALLTLTSQAFAFNPQPDPPAKARFMRTMPLTGAVGTGGRSADYDDNYCGTKVPGHVPHGGGVRFGSVAGSAVADYDDNYCGTHVPGHLPGPIHFAPQGQFNAH
jgi:hypothetical protein